MPRALHVVPPPPSLRTALARSRFAARTRKSYAQDLAPLLARVGEHPVTSLTHQTTAVFLATQEHLAATTFNRRYAALRSFARWCQQQGWLEDEPLDGLERRPPARKARSPRRADLTADGYARLGPAPASSHGHQRAGRAGLQRD
jgi:site-specific recombinase XerD